MPAEIVLVGNGPSLLYTKLGSRIDSFPEVVRFNGYRLPGYEVHVGSRTTIWSRWYALQSMQPMEGLGRIWINMPLHERTIEKERIALEMLGGYREKAVFVPEEQVAASLQLELFGTFEGTKWPSSGLLAVAHSLSVGYVVHLAGFDSWAGEPFHYYETHDRSNSHHVPGHERSYLEKLAKAGMIRFL